VREQNPVQLVRIVYTKGVFHNASHFINLCSDWFGGVRGLKVWNFSRIPHGDFAADFEISFEKCPRVVFQQARSEWYELNEMEIFTKAERIRFLRGGREVETTGVEPFFRGANQLSAERKIVPGTIFWATGNMIDNVISCVSGRSRLKMPVEDAAKTLEICEKILKQGAGRDSGKISN
jgi:hypothetical protein